MCENLASQFVPKGFTEKEIFLPCGSTSIHGTELLCDECEAKAEEEYPQGWRESRGDTCKHGTYIGDAGGADYLCPYCEAE
jgi:hypothetical protein